MIIHEINNKVFGVVNDIVEIIPPKNPKEFMIAKTHYYIDGIEVSRDKIIETLKGKEFTVE